MADDTNNLNNSAFGEDVSEKKLAFREKQKKARLSGKSYMTLNKHTRKEIAAKPLPAVERLRYYRKKCRSARMQVMEDLQKVIEEARPSKPFKVLKMADHFFDFDKAASSCIDTKKTRHQSDFRDQSGSN
ncbi:hypothetical protein J6590_083983 [Homalodisca vitripennis]|nr:hypothetical protein J6590_043588 [Homalodisca vitripennis]KAG8290358.1 hypothetical protein J6590_083983 [Homalodisca vitripennis]